MTDPGGVVAPVVMDKGITDYTLGYQPLTVSASLTPSRSRYGTLQNPSRAPTVSAKRIWTFSGVFLTSTELQRFDQLFLVRQPALNAGASFLELTDGAKVFFETGSAETFDVKLVVDENYRANRVLEDRQNGQTIWQVSFTALEV
jgi:hypothetical protein